ncbi:Helix-turn-helix domain-containing protein [Polaromonas sp. OV174]|uniref:helix-turn-helix domain-containing protein n=1 Tax=Polaromonas sp. OV174 TaxID=1855300 RepID=UPI0008E9506E|nr:helix-turn-helix domain-containing protein [Polaromonas sp. OV174]SFC13082.1 Helix-turn-helix domain-containing protein [Polaromonas sp. OV174]
MTYKHLIREERYQTHTLRRQGISLGCIAAELGRSRSTISREFLPNAGSAGYKPAQAHGQARSRQLQHQINEAVYLLNHRPRKCLGYRTPHEVFDALKMHPITLPFVALCT